jgi:hypothetical protein
MKCFYKVGEFFVVEDDENTHLGLQGGLPKTQSRKQTYTCIFP